MGIFPGSNGSSHREMPRGAHPEEARTPHEFVNDPSAGSPTETLLRLLLPLNDKVRVTSRLDVPFPEATIQSENLTGPFNR